MAALALCAGARQREVRGGGLWRSRSKWGEEPRKLHKLRYSLPEPGW